MDTKVCAQIVAELTSKVVGIAAVIGERVSKLLADKKMNK